ncbi:hypothetical protein PTKIN_Ptkin14bG0223800 [Pterospermum kingtungense]
MEAIWVQLLLLVSLLFLIKRMIVARKQPQYKLPPGPPQLPIIGNLHHLVGGLPHHCFNKLSKKYGPIFSIRLGSVPGVVVSTAKLTKEVLQTHDLECCSRPLSLGTQTLSYNYMDVAFTPYGKYWREMRKICVLELFSVKRVNQSRLIREEEVGHMMDAVSELASSATPVNFSQKLMSLTAEVTSRVAFGRPVSSEKGFRFRELVHEATLVLGSLSGASFFPLFGKVIDRITGYNKRLDRTHRELDHFFQKILDEHVANGAKKRLEDEDIIDVLQKIKQNQSPSSEFQLTDKHIKGILVDILLGGIETSATVMEWTMTELILNPRVMKKVQEEIRNVIGNKGKITESDLDHFEYLRFAIREATRLHPAAALLVRETSSQININGYDIAPKTVIWINVSANGRDPESWENPEQYYPERFIDSSVDFKGQHFELLPFGAGRRGCPGLYMGNIIVELALANLLYHFDWKLPNAMKVEDISMEEAAGVATYKKQSLQLVPTKYVPCN